jgi:hypothetical protein
MRAKKSKKVSYELIREDTDSGAAMYRTMRHLIDQHHSELTDARIALAWCTSWKPDADGRVTIGKCKKSTDLDREVHDYDFIILLSRGFWMHDEITNTQRTALLDHELMHAAVKYDDHGDPVEDDRGRQVYRTRKHSIEEFTEIIGRYGLYKNDLEDVASALAKSGMPKYEPCEKCQDTPSWGWVELADKSRRAVRCECFKDWKDRCAAVSEMRAMAGLRD